MARESATSVPTIARTELYGAEPNLSILYAWALALDIEASDLLRETEPTEAVS